MAELELVVRRRVALTPSIAQFDLAAAPGAAPLPGVAPGSHLTVSTPAGHRRSYSITERTEDGAYRIAVLREAEGRGGSRSMHDDVRIGDRLLVASPRNGFPLGEADEYLLIAGGIGITAIRALFRALRARGARARLLYLSRTEGETAYLDEFVDSGPSARVHHSALDGRVDLWPYLAEPRDGLQVYCCGARPLMEEVRALTMHWRPSDVRFEDFAGAGAVRPGDGPFQAIWAPAGRTVEVAAGGTLLDALNRSGADVASSCRTGTCGTCVLRLIEGEAEHRDLVLDASDRGTRIIPCVSRAAGAVLTVAPVP